MSDATTRATALLLDAFGRVHDEIPQILDATAPGDLIWRPDADANPIGWLIWHLARVQDDHLAKLSTACGYPREQVWPAWSERFGLPYDLSDIGYGHTSEQVGAFRVEDPDLLTGYHGEVHELTVDVLRRLSEADYDTIVDDSWDPPVTAASRLVSVLGDITAHTGHAAYVKGLRERSR